MILRNFCQQVTASRRTKVMPSISQAGHSMWVGIFCNHPIFFNSMGFIIEPEPDPVPFSSYIAIISESLFFFFSLAVLMNLSDLLSRCVDFKKSTKILACWIYIPPRKEKTVRTDGMSLHYHLFLQLLKQRLCKRIQLFMVILFTQMKENYLQHLLNKQIEFSFSWRNHKFLVYNI